MKTPLLAVSFLIATIFIAHADVRVRVADDVRGAGSIARYIERLGDRYLKPDQNLDITILDYKRSRGGDPFFHRPFGYHRPYGYPFGYRSWRDPFFDDFDRFDRSAGRLKVSYSLREKGRTIRSDTETITSWGDRFGPSFGGSVSDDHDEVRRWFRQRFAQTGRDNSKQPARY